MLLRKREEAVRTQPHAWIPVEEPVDCDRLAAAYKRNNWTWLDERVVRNGWKWPSGDDVRKAIEWMKRSTSNYCEWHHIKWNYGHLELHRRLFTLYVLPQEIASNPDKIEQGDWLANLPEWR